MVDANNNPFVATIPVAFTSFAIGQSLYNEANSATPPVMNLDVKLIVDPNRDDWNVIAESKGGDPNHVVVVDAHLDAIYGAGMLDNASGSATILNVAEQMRKVHPQEQAAVHLVRWRGARPARLGLLRPQPQHRGAESHQLRPRRRCDRDAELPDRRPRSGRPRPVQPDGVGDVPGQRVRAVEDRARLRRSTTSTRSTRTTCSCHPSGPTRSGSTRSASRPAAC